MTMRALGTVSELSTAEGGSTTRAEPQVTDVAPETARPTLRERLAAQRSRLMRGLFALLILAPGLWGMLHYFVLLRTTDAVVSTRTVTVRTPIAGFLRLGGLVPGDPLQNGQTVAIVENSRVDTTRLAELSGQVRTLDAQIEASQGTIERLQTFLRSLQGRGDQYATLRMSQLKAQLAEAMSQAAASRATAADAEARLTRTRTLLAEGLASEDALSVREGEHVVASAGVDSALGRSNSLTVELDSMRAGYMLDNFSDKPYSLHRVDEVELGLLRARVSLDEQTKSRRALQAELEEETHRVALLRRANIEAPAAGRLWKLQATNGEFVNVAAPILELVDCSKLMVVAQLPERKYARVRIGMRAKFAPVARNEIFDGVVAQKLGVTNPQEAPSSRVYGVAIRVPLLAAQLQPLCEIGLSGEVKFGN
jgi:multidrug resistance efflux pump